jgi:hypothetical protein
LEGFKSLRVADVEKPKPAANQILIEVMQQESTLRSLS